MRELRAHYLCSFLICGLPIGLAAGRVYRPSAKRRVSSKSDERLQRFGNDIELIRNLLHIPGMSAALVEGDKIVWERNLGFADNEAKSAVTPSTEFCIASVSKTMAAVILMQLRQARRLHLDDPVTEYLPDSTMPKNITIRQIMSHTSDGVPGEEFLYNGARYALLSRVIEKITREPYEAVLSNRLLRPLKMDRTIPGLGAAGYECLQRELAKPYRWDPGSPGRIQAGDLPAPGLTAATGVIFTVGDLSRYAIALDGDTLADPESKALMFTPVRSLSGEELPYGLGWFVQTYLGQQMVWHYGQEDSYASLFVRIPQRKLTLIVLANSNAMSDAFRLLDGNAVRSLVVLDFLRDVVFAEGAAEPAVRQRLDLDENIDQALARIYIGEPQQVLSYVQAALASGMLARDADLTTLYLLTRVHDPSLEQATESVGSELIRQHPHLSPALFYLGTYYQSQALPEKAIALFERIAAIQPPLRHWTWSLALLELAQWYAERDPSKARKYLQQIIASGYNFDGAIDKANNMLRKLPAE